MSYANRMRRDKIREFLLSHRSAGVKDLGRQLNASEATIRRDLRELAREDGYLRTRGGIALDESRAELSVQQRAHVQGWQKRSIGRKAAQLVSDGEVIFLGSGSTAIEVARNLDRHRDLTVITNSLPIITMLTDNPRVSLIVAGGALRRSELSFIGHIVEKTLMELRADKVIMGIHGIHPEHGLTNEYMPEAIVDRFLLRYAPQLIIVADSSKVGKTKASFVGEIEDIDVLVTDQGISLEMKLELEMRGVKVVIAEQAETET
ncbi:MAG: DeoR/GlpR family DNA-binding transcription regulator [Spirochaetia bacterium]|jgi:DeoR/GlpR family transcriptional regulator of sugar metabolism